ncbi:Crp/Fnr family transcriptional regulator [Breznakiella homolactica]|uniref:Crp/Fnr family transcriptional regulator n=1 Tax=Breznakiella homolactica TaxID=2798577 RepID=A0A7T8BB25_9SPIR|nr:Crp/Fnr family transcriptional regulator [Breznakiella homolactica]QQO09966.1 Crp/Fnr family transcriptional regulator [Breznakiella homolactica]
MTVSDYLEKQFNITLTRNAAALIGKGAFPVDFPRGTIVLHEGDRASNLYGIVSGLVRGFYIDSDGNDVTKCFSAEREFFSTEGFRTDSASSFSVECLEDCTCIRFPYTLIRGCMEEDEGIRNTVNTLFLREVEKLETRARKLMVLDAEERYRDFCREYPGLLSRVPLLHIASYIGIRPASLSRIRKKIQKNTSELT